RKRGLPSPSRWFQVARALHAALRIQARPDASMTAIALEMGFADHSALAHLLRRCLGVQAGMIRGTLGWEWLLQRWCISQRILPRCPTDPETAGGDRSEAALPPALLHPPRGRPTAAPLQAETARGPASPDSTRAACAPSQPTCFGFS